MPQKDRTQGSDDPDRDVIQKGYLNHEIQKLEGEKEGTPQYPQDYDTSQDRSFTPSKPGAWLVDAKPASVACVVGEPATERNGTIIPAGALSQADITLRSGR